MSSSGCFSSATITFNGTTATAVFNVVSQACVGRTVWLSSYVTHTPFLYLPGGDIVEYYPQDLRGQTSLQLTLGVNTLTVTAPGCPEVGNQVDLAFKQGTTLLQNGEYYSDADFIFAGVRNNECAVTGLEGCSHGYWKNHLTWPSPYTTTTLVSSVFSGPGIPAGYTFLEALQYNGGNKAQILLRNAVGAVLNTASSQLHYPLTLAALQQQVNAALAGTNDDKTSLNETLDDYNNLRCPLN